MKWNVCLHKPFDASNMDQAVGAYIPSLIDSKFCITYYIGTVMAELKCPHKMSIHV